MRGLNPFGGGDEEDFFDAVEAFVPENLPEPSGFLTDHEILVDDDHVDFHRIACDVFEQRGVYDMTFGYNLARLNLDRRHPNAGYRYARERKNPKIVRSVFTPTTPFCPQAHTLATGSFRAWNGLRENYEYDLVRVRVDDMHHDSDGINKDLTEREELFEQTGDVTKTEDEISAERIDPNQRSSSPF